MTSQDAAHQDAGEQLTLLPAPEVTRGGRTGG
ncbi:MAG: hypothetical protein K0R97_1834, partial [Oerskovia sp.]|nr:hypothetical protein [Oerskovia sp.]